MIENIVKRRLDFPQIPGLKINLYRGFEYRAVAQAISDLAATNVESVMIGDSYFMTHLDRSSTRLSKEDQKLAVQLLPELVAEVRQEIDRSLFDFPKPLLMADVPDGLDAAGIRGSVRDFVGAGADIVKVEVTNSVDLDTLTHINFGRAMIAVHLGYTPQKVENRLYGQTAEEISNLKSLVYNASQIGASFVIFERVTEVANAILTRAALDCKIVPYSIFSGRAFAGGQSLNVWDAVIRNERESIFFPPTAYLSRDQVSEFYSEKTICEQFAKLIQLANANIFPPSPHNKLPVDRYIEILEEHN